MNYVLVSDSNYISFYSGYYKEHVVKTFPSIQHNGITLYCENRDRYIACDEYSSIMKFGQNVRRTRYCTVELIDLNLHAYIGFDMLLKVISKHTLADSTTKWSVPFTIYRKSGFCTLKVL